jgi:copper resistance protein B
MNHCVSMLCVLILICVTESSSAQDHSRHHPEDHPQHPNPVAQVPAGKQEPTESERRHVPPDPPQHEMGDMSNEEMIELMAMDDNGTFGMVMLDQFEWRKVDREDALATQADAWYGNDYNKAWFKAEGEIIGGEYEGRTELLWDRVVSRWFNLQAGIRHDLDEGPSRSWLAFGVQGLAPYWLEIEATAYVGDAGRTALRFSGEYEVLFTQRLILQPEVDVDIYGKDDPKNGIGAGLSEAEFALRLRYEIRREFAPYVGVVWSRRFRDTADFARREGLSKEDFELTAGIRAWF